MTSEPTRNPYEFSSSDENETAAQHRAASKQPSPTTIFIVSLMAVVAGLVAFVFTCFGVGLAGVSFVQKGDTGLVLIAAFIAGIIASIVVVRLVVWACIPKKNAPEAGQISASISQQNDQGIDP